MILSRVALVLGVLICSPSLLSAEKPVEVASTQIRWFLPADFAEARAAALAQKRILIIKGISFGVDEVGARNATKGCW